MAGTGRKPYTTTDVVPWHQGNPRLRPPESLAPREKQAFLHLVTTTPLAQFQPCDLPLMCRWAEATVQAEVAAAELAAHGMVTPDGKISAWFSIHQQATKTLNQLALRLRLGPQSRASKAPKTQPSHMSYYERAVKKSFWCRHCFASQIAAAEATSLDGASTKRERCN